MKAVQLFAPGDLRCVDVPIPEIAPDEVLVRVAAVGVCGSDIPRVLKKGTYRMPLTIGHEFSGTVVGLGKRVQKWTVGDRVTVAPLMPCFTCHWCLRGAYHLCDDYDYFGSRCDGALAEYVRVPSANLVRLPEGVDMEAGAMTDPAATALHGLWRGKVGPGTSVAVYGTGAIGFFALQWANLMGADPVIAVDVFDDKLHLALHMGATLAFNAAHEDPVARILNATDGLGADLVIETAALPATQVQAIRSARKQGTVVLLGISGDALALPAPVLDKIMRHELNVTGSWNSNSQPFPGREWFLSVDSMHRGRLQAQPLISHRHALEEAPAVFAAIGRRDFSFNKVMFIL
jgi:L-iditol 2-dehydrogenase